MRMTVYNLLVESSQGSGLLTEVTMHGMFTKVNSTEKNVHRKKYSVSSFNNWKR